MFVHRRPEMNASCFNGPSCVMIVYLLRTICCRSFRDAIFEIERGVSGMATRSSSYALPPPFLGDCQNVGANTGVGVWAGGSARPAAASGERGARFGMEWLEVDVQRQRRAGTSRGRS